MTLYSTKDKFEEVYSDRDLPDIFKSHLSEYVDVSVAGREFHMAGLYKFKDGFHDAVFALAVSVVQMVTFRIEVNHVVIRVQLGGSFLQ